MDPNAEIPGKEHVVVPPELKTRMEEATASIEANMHDPVAEIVQPTQQMGMFAELAKNMKDYQVKRLGIMFKDAKAALGIIPFADKISRLNTARIAAKPIEGARLATTMSPDGVMGVSKKTVVEVAQDEIQRREATAVSAVNRAVNAQGEYYKADKAMREAEQVRNKATEKLSRATETGKGVEKATKRYQEANNAFQKAADSYSKARTAYPPMETAAADRLRGIPVPEPEKWTKEWASKKVSGAANRLAHIHTDEEFAQKFAQRQAEGIRHGVTHTDEELIRMVANGESPVYTKGQWLKRGAKRYGLHMLWHNLGPIINPVPDVPHLVTTVSYATEIFGGQWYAGLVPPVWQFLHDRYSDFKLSYDTSKKSYEIVKRHWNQRVDRMLEKKIEKSAGVFLKPTEIGTTI